MLSRKLKSFNSAGYFRVFAARVSLENVKLWRWSLFLIDDRR